MFVLPPFVEFGALKRAQRTILCVVGDEADSEGAWSWTRKTECRKMLRTQWLAGCSAGCWGRNLPEWVTGSALGRCFKAEFARVSAVGRLNARTALARCGWRLSCWPAGSVCPERRAGDVYSEIAEDQTSWWCKTKQPTTKGLNKGGDLREGKVDVHWYVQPFLRLTASMGSVTHTLTVTGITLTLTGFRRGLRPRLDIWDI